MTKQVVITVHKLNNNPAAKDLKMSARSCEIPSTASSIDPSTPRNAFPLPQIVVIVDKDTHAILAHIEHTAVMYRMCLAAMDVVSGMVISIKHVVVNPANTAACVAIAEKFSVYKFNS